MNEKNLKSFKDMSRDENSRIAKMGAKASAEAKRRKKTSKESIELLLSLPASNKNKEKLQENGINSDGADNRMVVVAKLYSEAMKGNIRAIELLLKGFELSEMDKEEIKLNKQKLKLEKEKLQLQKEKNELLKKQIEEIKNANSGNGSPKVVIVNDLPGYKGSETE